MLKFLKFKEYEFVLQAARIIDHNICSLTKINRRVVDDRNKLQPKLLGARGQVVVMMVIIFSTCSLNGGLLGLYICVCVQSRNHTLS